MSELEALKRENAELKLALGIAASFPAKVRMECKKRIDSKLASLDFITTLYDSANRAINESATKQLADIQADAAISEIKRLQDITGREFGDKVACFLSLYANKLRGEAK